MPNIVRGGAIIGGGYIARSKIVTYGPVGTSWNGSSDIVTPTATFFNTYLTGWNPDKTIVASIKRGTRKGGSYSGDMDTDYGWSVNIDSNNTTISVARGATLNRSDTLSIFCVEVADNVDIIRLPHSLNFTNIDVPDRTYYRVPVTGATTENILVFGRHIIFVGTTNFDLLYSSIGTNEVIFHNPRFGSTYTFKGDTTILKVN